MSIDTPSDRVGPTSPGTSSLESQRPPPSGTTDSALDERGERTSLGGMTYVADHNPPVVELLTETSTPVPSAVSRTSLREVTQHGSHDPSVAPSLAAARHDESKYDNNSTTVMGTKLDNDEPQGRGLTTTSSLYITSNAQMNDQTWGSPRSTTGATTSIGPHEQLSDREHHTGNVGSRETAATHAQQGDDGPYPGYPATSHDARRLATTPTSTDVQPTPAVEQCTMSNISGRDEQHPATMNNAARYAGTDIDPIILSPNEDCSGSTRATAQTAGSVQR